MVGIPLIVAASHAGDEVLRSRHVRGGCLVPGFEEEHQSASAGALLDLGRKLHERLSCKVPLIYGSDDHLDLIYRYRRELSEHYLFTLNDEPVALALHDKERFYELALAKGIRVPRTCKGGLDIASGIAALREPLLVKPRRKTDWHGLQQQLFQGKGKARVFATREELLRHPAFERYRDELIVQELIRGDARDLVSFHAYAGEDGEILASFCGRKVRTWPQFAGESSFIELTTDAEVDAAGREIAAKLGLKGPFKIDLIRDAPSGALYVLEINARFNLWHYLGAAHGVNLPEVAYEHLVHGRRTPSRAVAPTRRWLDLYRDYHAFREQRSGGSLSVSQWLSSLASPDNIYGIFAWDDPVPFMQWTGNFIAKACRQRPGRADLPAQVDHKTVKRRP